MAKNREPVPEPEHEESVGTEEEEEEESSDEEEGSEDERPLPKTRPQISTPQKHPPPPSSSEDEDDDDDDDAESDSDSDSPIRKPDPNIKPIASKPMMDDPPKSSAAASSTRKPRSKPGPTGPTSPTKPGAKRPAEKESEAKETKKSKKKPDAVADGESSEKKAPSSSVVVNDDAKKQLFQRLWSEEDEIVILKGMMDYAAKKKSDPVADIGAFLEFIKKSLHVDVTKTQLQDKIRRLKKKFENNASKEKNGKERTFSKPHEQNAYELSKKVWASVHDNNGNIGNEKVAETPKVSGSVVRKSRSKAAVALTPKFNEVEDKEMKDVEVENNVEGLKNGSVCGGARVSGGLGSSSVAEWIVNDGAKVIEGEKRKELEEKWRKINEEELELFLKRAELMCEQTRLILEGIRKSKR